jgi:uncharacterized protein (TIGR02588 family)
MRAFRRIKRGKVGAMESLTVVILAVAAIVIAAMVWAFLSSSVGMQQTSADFIITSVEVRQMSSGQCRIFINMRNNGGQSFTRLDLDVSGPGGTSWSQTGVTVNLPPGQSISATFAPPCLGGWVAGTPLLVRATLTTPIGVQVSKNVNTIIQYGA